MNAPQQQRQQQQMQKLEEQEETIVTVIESDGKTVWQVGSPVPGDKDTRILAIYLVDGMIEIFAAPLPGTEFDGLQQGLHFTLMPMSVKLTAAVARFDKWREIMDDMKEAAQGDDDDEPDEPEMPQWTPPAVPTPAPQATVPQGAPIPIPSYVPTPAQPSQQPALQQPLPAQSNGQQSE